MRLLWFGIILALAIVLDLWLMREMRRSLRQRGNLGVKNEQDVYVLGAYSPVLTWLKKRIARQDKWSFRGESSNQISTRWMSLVKRSFSSLSYLRVLLESQVLLMVGGLVLVLFSQVATASLPVKPHNVLGMGAWLGGFFKAIGSQFVNNLLEFHLVTWLGGIFFIVGIYTTITGKLPDWLDHPVGRISAWLEVNPAQVVCLVLSLGFALVAGGQASANATNMPHPGIAITAWIVGISLAILGSRTDPSSGVTSSQSGQSTKRRIPWQTVILVIVLTLFAFIVRVIDTTHIPITLIGDEGSAGLNAVDFRQGRANNIFGVGWRGFPAMYFFLQSLPIALFGRTTAALRLTSAIAGALTVGAVYLVGQAMFGRRTGLVAGIILAASHFHIHFSRIGLNNIWDGLTYTITLGALWYGWQTRKRGYFVLAGLSLGFCQYFYLSSRLLFVVVLVWMGLAALVDRPRLRGALPGLLVMATLAVVIALPLACFYMRYPGEFVEATKAQSILGPWMESAKQITGKPEWRILLDQFRLGFRAYTSEPLKLFYHPNAPILRPLPAILFVLGLVFLLLRPRDTRTHLIALWLITFGCAGALSDSSPAAQRYVASAPACALVVGYAIAQLVSLAVKARPQSARAFSVAALALVVFMGVDDLRFYFMEYIPNSYFKGKYDFEGYGSATAMRLAQYLQGYTSDWEVEFYGPPDLGYYTIPSLQFLVPDISGVDVFQPWGSPENPRLTRPNQIYIFLPRRQADLAAAQVALPGGKLVMEYDDKNELLYSLYQIPPTANLVNGPRWTIKARSDLLQPVFVWGAGYLVLVGLGLGLLRWKKPEWHWIEEDESVDSALVSAWGAFKQFVASPDASPLDEDQKVSSSAASFAAEAAAVSATDIDVEPSHLAESPTPEEGGAPPGEAIPAGRSASAAKADSSAGADLPAADLRDAMPATVTSSSLPPESSPPDLPPSDSLTRIHISVDLAEGTAVQIIASVLPVAQPGILPGQAEGMARSRVVPLLASDRPAARPSTPFGKTIRLPRLTFSFSKWANRLASPIHTLPGFMAAQRMVLVDWLLIFLVARAFCAGFLDLGTQSPLPGAVSETFQSLDWTLVESLMRYHQFPLWNPYLHTGLPYVADPMLHIYNPLVTVPVLLFGVLDGYKIALFLSFLAAALGMWWLGGILHMGHGARVWIGVLYAFAGQPVVRFIQGEYLFVFGFAWIPWCVGSLLLTIQAHRPRHAAMTAGFWALLFFCGNAYYAFLMSLGIILWVLVSLFRAQRSRPYISINFSLLWVYLLTGALALGLIAIQLLPLMEFSPRMGKDLYLAGSHTPWQVWLDYTSKALQRPDAYPELPASQETYAYIGYGPFVALALLPLALWKRERKPILFFILLLVLALAYMDLNQMPWRGFYARTLFLRQFRLPVRMLVFGSFTIIVLAGLSLDTVWKAVDGLARQKLPAWRANVAEILRYGVGAILGIMMIVSVRDVFKANSIFLYVTQPSPLADQVMSWLSSYDGGTYYVRNDASWYNATISHDLRFIQAWYHFADIRSLVNSIGPYRFQAWPNYWMIVKGASMEGLKDAVEVYELDPIIVYRLPHSMPFAFKVTNEQLIAPQPPAVELQAEDVQAVPVRVRGPNDIEITAEGQADITLVVLTTHYPGWQVTVDGHRRALLNVSGYLGVSLPPGVHTVVFSYRPVLFWVGFCVSLLTLGVMLVVLIRDKWWWTLARDPSKEISLNV